MEYITNSDFHFKDTAVALGKFEGIHRGHQLLMDEVKKYIREEVEILENKGVRDWATIKSTLKDHIRDYIFQKTKRNPMILPIIMSL